ncbi:hypothetical protein [Streptococcus pacificus]|uniref:Lipoprotein n=1 Tax=Streptococcus pacificus TaxID=2740577 RepID=A0ABS0ZII1_9STRE|nr:hypothetical protein [Streptococcus pacificus]MBJ8325648.1 hypothetical protein [Streptococcus pacificus]
MLKKNKVVLGILLTVFSFILISCSNQKNVIDDYINNSKEAHVVSGGELQFMTDKKWRIDEEQGPFDLQLWHDSTYMGVMVYHLIDFNDDLNSGEKLLNFHIDDLKGKRNDFIEVEPLSVLENQGNSHISQVVYSGVKKGESEKFIYFFNMITFDDNPDLVAFVLMTTHPSDFEKERPELDDILSSGELLKP